MHQITIQPPPIFEVFKKMLPGMSMLAMRGMLMSVQVISKQIIMARDSEQTLKNYAAFTALESLFCIILFESLSPIAPYLSGKLANASQKKVSEASIGQSFRTGLSASICFAGFAAMICIFAPVIFKLADQDDDIIANSKSYFLWWFLVCFFDTTYRAMVRFSVARNELLPSVLADAAEGVLDVGLTAYFIFHGFGVQSAAMAYGLASSVVCLGYTLFLKSHEAYQSFALFDALSISANDLKMLTIQGGETAVVSLSQYLSQWVTTLYLGQYNKPSPLAGLAPANAFSTAVGYTFVASTETIGPAIKDSVVNQNLVHVSLSQLAPILGLIFSVMSCFLVAPLEKPYIDIFYDQNSTDYNATFLFAQNFLRIEYVRQMTQSVALAASACLIGYGITRYQAVASFFGLGLLNLASASVARFYFPDNVVGIATSQLIGQVPTTMALLWRLFHIGKDDLDTVRKLGEAESSTELNTVTVTI